MKAKITFEVDISPIKTKRGGNTEMTDDMMQHFREYLYMSIDERPLINLFKTKEGTVEDVLLNTSIDYDSVNVEFLK